MNNNFQYRRSKRQNYDGFISEKFSHGYRFWIWNSLQKGLLYLNYWILWIISIYLFILENIQHDQLSSANHTSCNENINSIHLWHQRQAQICAKRKICVGSKISSRRNFHFLNCLLLCWDSRFQWKTKCCKRKQDLMLR